MQVAHSPKCPAYADATRRCRRDKPGVCTPHYRRRLYDPVTGKQPYSPSTTVLSEALGASLDARKGNAARVEAAAASRTLEDVALEWWPRFKKGRVPKRRGAGLPSETTINGYRPLLFKLRRGQDEPTDAPLEPAVRGLILAEFGHRPGDEIAEVEWQRWIDAMDVSRSRLDEILAAGLYGRLRPETQDQRSCDERIGGDGRRPGCRRGNGLPDVVLFGERRGARGAHPARSPPASRQTKPVASAG
jgi:hypothetical protein